jgi:hypothetical protein
MPSKSKSKKSKGAKWDYIWITKCSKNEDPKSESPSSIDAVFDELPEDEGKASIICEGTRSSGFMMMEEHIEEYKPIGKYVIKCSWIIRRIVTVFSPLWCFEILEKQDMATILLPTLPDSMTIAYEAACKEYDCYKCVLGRQKDFLKQKSGIEEPYDAYNLEHGTQHRCLFLPKFHPELNYIESYWGRMKYYVRLYLIAQHQRSRSIC